MKESAKRILALVLSFVMIFTSLPTIANAATNDYDVELWGKGAKSTYNWGVVKDVTKKSNNDKHVTISTDSKLFDGELGYVSIFTSVEPGEDVNVQFSIDKYWPGKDYNKGLNICVHEAQTNLSVKTIPATMYVGDEINDVASVKAKQNDFFVAPTITMTSSDANVVEVVDNKLVAKAAGTATVSISASNGLSGLAYTGADEVDYEITVAEPGVEKVEIINKIEEMKNTETYDFNELVTVKGSQVSQEVTWTSSDEDVATVDENGLVTPVIGGATVVITATSKADPTKSDSVEFRINWNSNNGNSPWEHINVKVQDNQGNLIDGADVTITLQEFKRLKMTGFLEFEKVYEDHEFGPTKTDRGNCQFNIANYERLYDAKAEKEGYYPAYVKIDEYIGAFAKANEYVTITMTPIVNYTVKYVYEDNEISNETVPEGTKYSSEKIAALTTKAESLAAELTEADQVYTYTFVEFDQDLTDVAINENKTVNAVIRKTLKGNKAVNFYELDGNNKVLLDDDEYSDKEVKKQWIEDNKNNLKEKIEEEYEDLLSNYVVSSVTNNDDEVEVVISTIKYIASFVAEKDEKIKADRTFYVLDRVNNDNFTSEAEDDENIEMLIDRYELGENVRIENSEESYVYKNAFEKIAEGFKLLFTKKIANPVTLEHKLAFTNCHISDDNQSGYYPNEYVLIGEPKQIQKINDQFVADDYYSRRLNEKEYRHSATTFANDIITMTYWAKRINVEYVGIDEKGEAVNNFKDGTHKIVNYVEYMEGEEESNDINVYSKVLDDELKPAIITIGEVNYVFDNCKLTYNHSCNPNEHNAVTLTLTYKYTKQANCEHENKKYIDNEDGTHDLVCTDCKLVLIDNERHTFDRETHKCVCGAKDPNRVRTIENIKIKLPEGVVTMSADKLYDYTVDKAPAAIAEAINDMEEDEMSKLPEELQYDDVDDEDVVKVLTNNFDFAEHWYMDNDGYVVKDINFTSPLEYFYKVRVDFVRVEGKFNQVEIKNDLRYDSVYNTIAQEVRRQKETNSYKLPERFEVSLFDEQGNKLSPDKAALEYGKVYAVEVVFNRFDGQTEFDRVEFTGKVHLYHGSSKKKKKNTDLPDGLLPQGGAGIADLRTNRPDDMLTRSEFIGVLSEIFSVLDTENYKDFTDINGDANEQAIKQLSSFGIVQGYCEDTFGPNDFITREQMYTFIARALKFSGKASQLTDEQINAALSKVLDNENVADWAKDGVATSIEKELVNETEKAQDTIKRVEAADKLEKFAAILFTEAEEEIK